MGKKRWLIGCGITAGAVLVIGGSIFGYLYHRYVDFGEAAAHIDADVAAYRAAGMPWEAKDIGVGPTPSDQNGTPLLDTAMSSAANRGASRDMDAIQKDLAVNNAGSAAKLLAPHSADLALIEKAVSRPRLDLGIDPDVGPWEAFTRLQGLRSFVHLLCLRAQLAAARNDPAAAAHDLGTAWKLSILAGQSPGLEPMLSEVAGQNTVADAIQRCAAALKQNIEGLRLLGSVISRPDELASFQRSLFGHAYAELASFRNPEAYLHSSDTDISEPSAPPPPRSAVVRTGIPEDTKWRGFMARHCEAWTEVKAAMDKYGDNTYKLQSAIGKIEDEWYDMETVSRMIVPIELMPLQEAGIAVVKLQAEVKATRALLSAMQVRIKTGTWPARIEDVPGTWTDPFTGEPMKLKFAGDSIKIYSVGPNLRDDGGVRQSEITEDAKKNDYDIVASYPPRPLLTPARGPGALRAGRPRSQGSMLKTG